MATYTISNPCNTSLQTEAWTLSLSEAKNVCRELACLNDDGSYWVSAVYKPYRAALRQKAATVRIYTAGFSSGAFSNALYASGAEVSQG